MFFKVTAYVNSDRKRKKTYLMVAKNFDDAIATADKIHGKNLVEIALQLPGNRKEKNYE